MSKSALAPTLSRERFEFEEFEKLCVWLESDKIFSALKKLNTLSEAELLRQMVGDLADTRELLNAPESSKYPLAIAQIRLIQELRKVTRRIEMTRKLRVQYGVPTPIAAKKEGGS
jgi:hypothetical protein